MINRVQLILAVAILSFPLFLSAQFSQGGIPYALKEKMSLPPLNIVDNSELYDIDSSYTKDCSAMEFARFLPMEVVLGSPKWQTNILASGDQLHRLAISSPGAKAIALYFKDFHIPGGASLFFYDPELEEYYGSYTSENNSEQGFFCSEMLAGDKIVVEYYEPKQVAGEGSMKLFEILHAYRTPFSHANKDFGDSGDCEVNVNCPEGYGKANQKNAVLRLLIKNGSSGSWCTGTLVNNTSVDKTPYVLTADHCGKYSSDEDMNLWRFYFSYQSAGCENPEEEPNRKTLIGCEMIAASSNMGELGSDFFLVKLTSEIPASYNPYFIGWNRNGAISNQGYTIHHPQGDIKKISTYTEALSSATYPPGIANAYWEVHWAETTSGHGVTEGGSSGSPIFDNEGYLIGTLTGGQASCSALEAPDYYGKFAIHWEDNGSAPNVQLAPWLDPDNTGIQKLDGIYLDIDEFQQIEKSGLTLVPNPAKDHVKLLFDENIGHVQVDLYHVNGSLIHSYFFSNSSSINISNLPRGVYLLRLVDEQKSYVQKLIKE
jgi:hypothetical protein